MKKYRFVGITFRSNSLTTTNSSYRFVPDKIYPSNEMIDKFANAFPDRFLEVKDEVKKVIEVSNQEFPIVDDSGNEVSEIIIDGKKKFFIDVDLSNEEIKQKLENIVDVDVVPPKELLENVKVVIDEVEKEIQELSEPFKDEVDDLIDSVIDENIDKESVEQPEIDEFDVTDEDEGLEIENKGVIEDEPKLSVEEQTVSSTTEEIKEKVEQEIVSMETIKQEETKVITLDEDVTKFLHFLKSEIADEDSDKEIRSYLKNLHYTKVKQISQYFEIKWTNTAKTIEKIMKKV